jgi:hypothetical protein
MTQCNMWTSKFVVLCIKNMVALLHGRLIVDFGDLILFAMYSGMCYRLFKG